MRIMREPGDTCARKGAGRPANRPDWLLQSLREGVWTSRFFGIHDPDALDEHFFNGLLGILILLSSSSTSNSLCGLRKACNATERSFQIAPPSSVGKSIATALLVVEYALLLTKETTKSLNRAAPLSKLILTQFR
ncbi:MAG TPA: hypothetical protein PKZ19_10535 [Zoogloea sp.]|nr:hypothetical protein [Zoogloea sp.]